MASSAFFSRFRTSSCSLILSPVNSPRESEIEEENSISASFVSSEIAKEIATFFKSCSIEKTDEKGITLAYELHKATLEENYDLDAIMQEYRTECEEAEEEDEPDTEEAWEEEEISDSLFTLDTEEEYKPAKDTEVIRESGGVWSAWKKAAHKISRGRLGRWGSWDDLILETDGQDESTHL